MNILLISQCEKRALTETRRILDQFAERRGERVWQTPITHAGLDTLRKLLRKTARKNTAVACHWIRGLDHSELLWIVGDARRFNAQGATPTNTTTHDILRREDENDWHTLEDIRLLAQMAALLHDLGKASVEFQKRLRERSKKTNLYRHEWVSLRLFLAFVGQDGDQTWLSRMAGDFEESAWLTPGQYFRDGQDKKTPPPFADLLPRAPLAAAIAWLIVSHHRLPTIPAYEDGQQQWLGKRSMDINRPVQLSYLLAGIAHNWNEKEREADPQEISAYWEFKHALPVSQPRWRAQAKKVATRLLTLCGVPGKGDWLNNPYIMHLARLTLMLADHRYSALPPASSARVHGESGEKLFANTYTDKEKDISGLNQPLDEHLLGVAKSAASIAHALPDFERQLSRLARHRGLRQRSQGRFGWQNKAADKAEALRPQTMEQGAFIINMASTGCGKTLANARVMYALADPQKGMRCTFALGLRVLTLQTGESYHKDLHLGEDELAVQVGGSASRALFDYFRQRAKDAGSESQQALIEEDSHVIFDGPSSADGLLGKATQDSSIHSLLSAPMLVCTIDHLTPATEAQRAGRQIAPMLRLMSSDLVLDELDDFDLNDLHALTRLTHWAGLLGTRVLISSATLPPALLEGLYLAYRAGRQHFQRNRGAHAGQEREVNIPCLWIDEFGAETESCASQEVFRDRHTVFVQKRVKELEKVAPYRRGVLLPLSIKKKEKTEIHQEFARHVRDAIIHAHDTHHHPCPKSGKQVSFGLVRMANIEPLFDVALELFKQGAPENYRIHLCVYHSRFPLLLRSAIEARLDAALNRREPEAVYALPEIRQAIDRHPESHHVFVVLGSPVAEVGRDHDYDWAVVEPSSMRSLIQLAGRVQRHRNIPCPENRPNIFIFDTNLRHFGNGRGEDGNPLAAFVRPGFEAEVKRADHPFRLTTHRLEKLLRPDEYQTLTARPRIQPHNQAEWQAKESLVDLEHARLFETMMPVAPSETPVRRGVKPETTGLNAACAWQYPQAALTWALPQHQPFRADSALRETALLFLPDEDDESRLILHRIEATRPGQANAYTKLQDAYLASIDLRGLLGPNIAPWGENDLPALLEEQAQARGLSLRACAQRFTTVNVIESERGWRYHPVLGFAKV
ncbi:MAG: type I-F CRISPR-associated helicase Cas3f [Azoarcus sp.]|jgi:CRISPR-associated endonuclease/helicase Cas3|nr:type I-F CRISPR-associated helicase Cas3f [Azoarcus sp.]